MRLCASSFGEQSLNPKAIFLRITRLLNRVSFARAAHNLLSSTENILCYPNIFCYPGRQSRPEGKSACHNPVLNISINIEIIEMQNKSLASNLHSIKIEGS